MTNPPATLRERWNDGGSTLGVWLSVPSTITAELIAGVGFDYTCLDLQHGAIDYQAAVPMIQAVLLGGGTPIARAPWNEPGIVGKLLDAGAQGVIVPMVNSPEEASAVVRAMRYPPHGSRSFGPVMAAMRNPGHHAWSAEGIAVIPMIETVEALRNLHAILAVPHLDAVYVGPADLSASLGLPPQNNDGEQLFDEALADIVKACRQAGVVPGIHASPGLAAKRLEQGFRMVTVSSDTGAMRSALMSELARGRSGEAGGAGAPGGAASKAVY